MLKEKKPNTHIDTDCDKSICDESIDLETEEQEGGNTKKNQIQNLFSKHLPGISLIILSAFTSDILNGSF